MAITSHAPPGRSHSSAGYNPPASAAALQKILIIDDESDVVDLISLNLRKAGGFQILTASDGAAGLRQAREEAPSLILLDLMLPKMPGLEVCKVLKTESATRNIPIIMLSAKADEVDRVVGLELGADDYVTKPFSPRELILRVKAVIARHDNRPADEVLTLGSIVLDVSRNQASVGGKIVSLTTLEFKLLTKLMRGRGRVHARDRLLSEVWGYETLIDTRTVDTHVRRLRKKLGKAADAIVTVRGFGYRMRDTDWMGARGH